MNGARLPALRHAPATYLPPAHLLHLPAPLALAHGPEPELERDQSTIMDKL